MDDLIERRNLVADAILLERAAKVLLRHDEVTYGSEHAVYLGMIAAKWRREAEPEPGS